MPALAAAAALGLLVVRADRACASEVAREIEHRLAAPVLPSWLAPEGRSAAHWAALRNFYKGRGYEPAWSGESGLLPQAAALLEAVAAVPDQGLAPDRYAPVLALPAAADPDPSWPTALADRDLRLSCAFLRLAHDLLEGRVSPRGASAYWSAAPAPEVDGAELLRRSVEGPGPAALLRTLAPEHAQYAALRRALAEHRAIAAAGGWPQVGEQAARPRRGRRDPRLRVLRQRLAVSGDLETATAAVRDPDLPDPALLQALKRFQARHGLAPDGRVGPATLAALDVPVEERVAQMELNLERWRWLPRDLGPRYVLVNVPAFELHAVDGGRTTERMKVVTGRAGETPTPIFSAEMETVAFSPWWNVPPRIAEEEIVPALQRSRGYLRRRGLLAVGGESAVQFRQPPGPTNPMGWVKFLFPNPFNVYLHDTPNDSVFAAERRDLSHGCMRVERPLALARWALNDPAQWPDARIRAAMRAGSERTAALARPIPVHVAYFTAWVEGDGTVRFLPDVYGHDEAQLALLRGESPWQRLAVAAPDATAGP